MPAKVLFGLAAAILLATTARADDPVTQQAPSDITIQFDRDSTGGIEFDAAGKRTWFDLFAVDNGCIKSGAFLTKYEQWVSHWTSGMMFLSETTRLQFTTYPVDKGGTKPPIYSVTVVPDATDDEFTGNASYGGADVTVQNQMISVRVKDDPYRNFDWATGRLLFMSDKPAEAVTVVGEDWCKWQRYFAYTTDYPKLRSSIPEEFVASVSISSNEGILQTVIIRAARDWRASVGLPANWQPDPRLKFDRGPDKGSHGTAGSETSAPQYVDGNLLVTLDPNVVISIPLREDRMVLEEASLPDGLTVLESN